MRNEYKDLLLNKNILVINGEKTNSFVDDKELGAILLSFSSIGYTLDMDSIELLKSYSLDSLKDFYFSTMETLKKAKGANVKHIVFYNNFPNMEHISETEYVLRAILHYYTVNSESYGYMAQDIEKEVRPYLMDKTKLEVLKVVEEYNAYKILIDYANALFESKKAIPFSYNNVLKLLVNDYYNVLNPKEIPFKENLATYARLIANVGKNNGVSLGTILSNLNLSFIKTSTDLLRIYVAFSNGDITLAKKTKFISLNREGRRVFLNIFNEICKNSSYVIDDMAKHEFLWKRALEKLHIGDYANIFNHAYEISCELRNDEYKTYNSKINEAYVNNNIKELIRLLSIKPGVFARSLDALLRNSKIDTEYVLDTFENIVTKVSSPLLLQLWEFYKNRNLYDTRIFVIKGMTSFIKEIEENRSKLDEETISKVLRIIELGLTKIYATKEKINNVYLDECLKNYAIPSNSRNASTGAHTLTFGTRIKLDIEENKPVLRFFTHWKNDSKKEEKYDYCDRNRVDIDLSLQVYDENFNNVAILSWHNMGGGSKFNTYHSGDITSAPEGASEFIDLDFKAAREFGGRYAIVCNNVYTGQEFADIPECFSGIMFRSEAGKTGEIYEPSTVKYKYDLTQKGSAQNIAFIIDLKTMEMIWTDYSLSYMQSYAVAADSRSTLSMVMVMKRALQKHMSIYELFKLHGGHLNFVDDKAKAEFIIDDDSSSNISTYDFEKISAEWL